VNFRGLVCTQALPIGCGNRGNACKKSCLDKADLLDIGKVQQAPPAAS
jgi:hypothetical protein